MAIALVDKLSKNELIKLYWEEKKPLEQIAKENDCGLETIRYWMVKYGISRRTISKALTGKKFQDEHKKNLSEGHKGQIAWNRGEHTGIIPWNKGKKFPHGMIKNSHQTKHHTEEHKEKISQSKKGRQSNRKGAVLSEETKNKLRLTNSGSNHPQWKGGISKEPYPFNFNDELKELVRKRDSYKCQLCSVPQMECIKKLCVHHIDYDKENLDPKNLTTLCNSCNAKVNFHREKWIRFFEGVLR